MRKPRLLYIDPGGPLPPVKSQWNFFSFLSEVSCGTVLSPRWGKGGEAGRELVRAVDEACGNFEYFSTRSFQLPKIVRFIWENAFYVLAGTYLHYFRKRYDVVMCYGVFRIGIIGWLLKLLTGAKFLVFVPGNPLSSFSYESPDPPKDSGLRRIKMLFARVTASFVIRHADHLWLLYPEQLNDFSPVPPEKTSIFHAFVPVKCISPSATREDFIFALGYPWYLKGFDLLIKAFQEISPRVPWCRLHIAGFCPDKSYFRGIAGENHRIMLGDPLPFEEVMRLLSRASVFALPSRTEAMGRVLLEAMAAGAPVVASRVDGIPYYVQDRKEALLFESENVDDLASKLLELLINRELAAGIAQAARDRVCREYSEERFVRHFSDMLECLLRS